MRVFYIFLSWRVKAIASLIFIYLHLEKISRRHYLRMTSLPKQHVINLLLDDQYLKKAESYYLSIGNLTSKQQQKIKSSIVDTNSQLNEVLSYASPPICKLHPHGDIISQLYKPTFHSSHLSHNIPYGSTATIQVFYLPWWRYSYLTQSSMTELLLSVSQYWNLHLG